MTFSGYSQDTIPDFVQGQIGIKVNDAYPFLLNEWEENSSFELQINNLSILSQFQNAGVTRIDKMFDLIEDKYPELSNIYLISFSDTFPLDTLLRNLSFFDEFDIVEKMPVYTTQVTPEDDLFSNQWAIPMINGEDAWDITKGSFSTKIGVIDDAFRINHEDLRNKIWVNQEELPSGINDANGDGYISTSELLSHYSKTSLDELDTVTALFNGLDDDNNTYVDDIFGYSVLTNSYNVNPPTAYYGHGTKVAGVSSAETSETPGAPGIAGMAWDCSFIPIRSSYDFNTYIYNPNTAIQYAILQGCDVINMSFASLGSSGISASVIEAAYNDGILFVAAAGNVKTGIPNYQPRYPAATENVISVGGSNSADYLGQFSCHSSPSFRWVDLVAPGKNIQTCEISSDNSYGSNMGTSFSSPLVAGVCALMRDYCPTCTSDEIVSCLYSSCDPLNGGAYDPNFANSDVGHGRLNAEAALECIAELSPVANFSLEEPNVCAGAEVAINNHSSGRISSYQWSVSTGLTIDNSSIESPTIFFNLSPGESYSITLVVTNNNLSGASSTDTYSITGTVVIPSANIVFPAEALNICDYNFSYFVVEFINANPPYDLYYQDDQENLYEELGIMENPYKVNIDLGNEPNVTFSLISMNGFEQCSGYANDTVKFINKECKCEELINNHWNFAKNSGIQFEETALNPINEGYYFSPDVLSKTISVSDNNGDFLFRFNGETVWDKSNMIMEGGSLNQDKYNEVLAIPKSISQNTYYIITHENQNLNPDYFYYSVVDMDEPGVNGGSNINPHGKVISVDNKVYADNSNQIRYILET